MNFHSHTRRGRHETGIDITALVDVVFLLIIFLLVTTTFKKKEYAYPLQLPTSTEEQVLLPAETEQATVFVSRAGDLFFLPGKDAPPLPAADATEGPEGLAPIAAAALEEQLRALVRTDPNVVVNVRAQNDASYQRIIDVLGACYRVGISNVLLPFDLERLGPAAADAPATPTP